MLATYNTIYLLVVDCLLDQIEDLGSQGSVGQGVGLGVDFSVSALKQNFTLTSKAKLNV
jgi:hypothetical protein